MICIRCGDDAAGPGTLKISDTCPSGRKITEYLCPRCSTPALMGERA